MMATDRGFVETFDSTRISMQHELTHWIFHNAVPGLPAWLNEGLAKYWESLRLEDGQAIIGSIPPMMDCSPTGRRRRSSSSSTSWPFSKEGGQLLLGGVGRGVSALCQARRRFAHYLEATDGGARGEAAWRSAFGSFSANDLDAERSDWFSADDRGRIRCRWRRRCATRRRDRDAAGRRARLVGAPAPMERRNIAEVAQIRRPRSGWHPILRRCRRDWRSSSCGGSKATRRCRASTARSSAHPDDALLLRLRGDPIVARELSRPAGRATSRRRPCWRRGSPSGTPLVAVALRLAARVACTVGRWRARVALAERATRRAPDCAACFDTLAIARLASGRVLGGDAAGGRRRCGFCPTARRSRDS